MLTQADLDRFRDFAMHKVNNGGVNSLADCLRMWEEEREYEESIAMIRESLEDSAAGWTMPLDEAFAEIRRELGPPERRAPSAPLRGE